MWAQINTCIGRKCKRGQDIPNFFKENGTTFDNFKDIAEGFNDFFINIGEKLQHKLPNSINSIKDFLGIPVPYKFSFVPLNEAELILECSKLKPKTSQGLDILSNKIIKQLFPKIPNVITKLVNQSFKNGVVTTHLKNARVVTIYKDGSKSSFNNYRPISLISSFDKFIERLVSKQLLKFFNRYNLFYKNQYGFRAGHDTSHPLLHFTNNI